ncbi:DUF1540 domain-containing protein [Micromonospora sagamiensis]|uniref:Uncharacterized protein DUF1540 n=1 Tax=Micromonospora sagamiensis TaxID=47875 RepID=A0A562WB98_9ACTN|nr:DUF1540 domain-containing protein [Micromonospora sagamiensis]TWJ27486.1 uncharacterized protein DUF1540 [Micromonospora sagamiensis]BCL13628.1 hypothetical protein GCM10017556_13670 [Micromonospora sagamiensis]
MTGAVEMPRVEECTVSRCSYNENGCHAFAITVGSSSHARCHTFVEMPERGGIQMLVAQVGACQRADCRHNSELECHAPGIRVGEESADCLTYAPA